MRVAELIRKYPRLYHMAEDGSWPTIQKFTLLSTSALLTLYKYTGRRREQIESEWRPSKVTISCEGLDDAVVRDQKPMRPDILEKCLVEMTPTEWYRLINGMTFFWVTWSPSVEWFLGAREYCNTVNLIITVDTKKLLTLHESRVKLCGINSGSTYYDQRRYTAPKPRGRDTFKGVGDYDLPFVTELAVEDGVPDITDFTVSVARWIAHREGYGEPECQHLEDIWP